MSKNPSPAIIFDQVTKSFRVDTQKKLRNIFHHQSSSSTQTVVLENINFTINKGETVGLYGANGSGKTTILKLIAGILRPSLGQVTVKSTVAAVLELGAGLNPDLTGRENIELYGAILGLNSTLSRSKTAQIIKFSGLGSKIDWQLRQYSSGMKSRLAFSIVVFSNADILLLDEVFAVGDRQFLSKSLCKLSSLKKKKTIVISSHNLDILYGFCDKLIKIKSGRMDDNYQSVVSILKSLPSGASFKARVTSNSMAPLFFSGDVVLVEKTNFKQLKVGDVVAVGIDSLQEVVMHRIFGKNDTNHSFITKGDAVIGLDSWPVTTDNFLGKVIYE